MKAVVWALLVPTLVCAEANRSWDTLVETVKVGKKVVVTRMNTSNAEGKLLAIDADTITVKLHGAPECIRRENVFRVRYADIRRHHALIGAAAGFAVCFATGVTTEWKYTGLSRSEGGLFFGAWGAGVGAATGALLPIGKPLYEVRK